MNRIAGLGFLTATLLLVSGTSAAAAVNEGASTWDDQKLTTISELLRAAADERNMSVAKFQEQLEWENAFALATTAIAATYPDDYAGAEILDGEPVVRFRGTAPAGAVKSLSSLSPAVRVIENLGWSESEIVAAGESAHYAVRAAVKGDVATDIDSAAGTITVYVVEGASRNATSALDQLQSDARTATDSFAVAVEVDPSLDAGNDALYGGGALTSCTAGFSVRNGSYANGIITADHCGNTQSFGSTALSYRGGSSTRDVQWHSSSTYAAPEIHWGFNGVYQVTGWANPVVGQYLYREGKTTGYTGDTTYAANQCRGSYCGMMTMNNRKADGGDSGGSWFSTGTAYGVHSGWVTIWGLPRDMFTPIGSGLSTLGISLKL